MCICPATVPHSMQVGAKGYSCRHLYRQMTSGTALGKAVILTSAHVEMIAGTYSCWLSTWIDGAVWVHAGVVRGLKMKSGFSSTEIFRKYLWYLLRERKFDEDAVADLAALRSALNMTDEEARTPLTLLESIKSQRP